jgi:protein-disulfide isomerase
VDEGEHGHIILGTLRPVDKVAEEEEMDTSISHCVQKFEEKVDLTVDITHRHQVSVIEVVFHKTIIPYGRIKKEALDQFTNWHRASVRAPFARATFEPVHERVDVSGTLKVISRVRVTQVHGVHELIK